MPNQLIEQLIVSKPFSWPKTTIKCSGEPMPRSRPGGAGRRWHSTGYRGDHSPVPRGDIGGWLAGYKIFSIPLALIALLPSPMGANTIRGGSRKGASGQRSWPVTCA